MKKDWTKKCTCENFQQNEDCEHIGNKVLEEVGMQVEDSMGSYHIANTHIEEVGLGVGEKDCPDCKADVGCAKHYIQDGDRHDRLKIFDYQKEEFLLRVEINKVIQGDCLEVMKDISDKSIDMVLTSPPYDNLRDYKGYTFNFEGIAKEIYRVLKDGGVCVWVVGDSYDKNGSETLTSFKQAIYFKEIGFTIHDTMIYQKNSYPFPPTNRYYQVFEYMFVISKGKPKITNIQKVPTIGYKHKSSTQREKDGTMKDMKYKMGLDTRKDDNIWKLNVGFGKSSLDKISFKHPATFPEKLAERHILSWSNEGDTVLDPMAGSGTTLKMAKKNNRNYIGIEISPEYIDIINKRLYENL